MKEKRKIERFDLHLETFWNVLNKGIVDKTPMLLTRNISSEGAYLTTNNPLPVGTNMDLNFFLSQQGLSKDSKDKKIKIWTRGKVIRTEEGGMAVRFEEQSKVSQLEQQA